MQRKRSKNKTQATARKAKEHTKIMKIYGANSAHLTSTAHTHKAKSKMHSEVHHRKSTETYEFPEFSLSFVEPDPHTLSANRMRKRQEPSSKHYAHEVHESKAETTIKIINSNSKQEVCINSLTDTVLALSKVFKTLDIFNRGVINHRNLNSLNQYRNFSFLVKAFEKIREEHLSLTERQFVRLCESLLKDSTHDEHSAFLKAFINQSNTLKQSIKLDNSEVNENLSPIQKRMKAQGVQFSEKNNGNLAKILDGIYEKEKKLTYMIRSVRERKKNMNSASVLQETKLNELLNIQNTSAKANFDHIFADELNGFKVTDFEENNPVKHQHIEQSSIPTFTFHLPQKVRASDHWPRSTDKLNIHPDCNKSEFMRTMNREQISTRLAESRDSDYRADMKSSTTRVQNSTELYKINELNKKLEESLQRSKSKIEKSKIFLLQNSSLVL